MRKLLLVGGVGLVLAGCGASVQQDSAKGLVAACSSYATGLKILAPRKAGLASWVVQDIDTAVAIIGPICTAPTPPTDLAGALAVVEAELPNITKLLQ